ncbi:MAG: aminotransferase class V-fold PLP-dependent enzyme, partial [Cellulomonas sp.]|nr:aminotransferase class V-fold PLP-dependent enzyme [Cellulomonas sp.]
MTVTTERGALLPVVGATTRVPLIDGTTCTYANLDYAASAPALESVAARVTEVLPLYASVHRGAGYLSQVSTALYEESRQTIARFVGARPDDVAIITRNTTDALNLLASCVPAGGRVLVLDVEHHANLLPWQRVDATVLPIEATAAATLPALERELAAWSYALVAATGASNV